MKTNKLTLYRGGNRCFSLYL